MQDADDDGSCKEACEGGGNVRPLDCGEPGACVDRAGERECNCDDGFTGPRCDGCNEGTQLVGVSCEPTCEGGGAIEALDCNFGSCEDPSVAGPRHCDCWTGYTGEHCDECAVGYQDNDGNGTCLASCAGGSFLAPETCSGHGTCADASGLIDCACEQGHVGYACDQGAPGYRAADAPGECELDEPSELGMKLWLDADHGSSLGLDESYRAAYREDRHDDAIELQAGATDQRPKYVAKGLNDRPVLRLDTGDELAFDHWTGLINEHQ